MKKIKNTILLLIQVNTLKREGVLCVYYNKKHQKLGDLLLFKVEFVILNSKIH